MELDPGSISLEQLMTICSALNLELQVQTKMRARSDSAGNSSIKAEW